MSDDETGDFRGRKKCTILKLTPSHIDRSEHIVPGEGMPNLYWRANIKQNLHALIPEKCDRNRTGEQLARARA
jgi:hypothetical protein